jgi:hypothetical protein
MLWPAIVARQTQVYLVKYTGQAMSPERKAWLRKELARIKRELKESETA